MSAGARILLVDDHPEGLEPLVVRLRAAGYDPVIAPDSLGAMDLIRAAPPALVVLDVVMPELNGYQLCRLIKKHDPDIVVVMLTSRSESADRFWAQQCGANLFLSRPVDPAAVLLRIAALLGES